MSSTQTASGSGDTDGTPNKATQARQQHVYTSLESPGFPSTFPNAQDPSSPAPRRDRTNGWHLWTLEEDAAALAAASTAPSGKYTGPASSSHKGGGTGKRHHRDHRLEENGEWRILGFWDLFGLTVAMGGTQLAWTIEMG